eukprot:1142810-Pelagomonas_calceolata.AAC.3
MMTAATVHGHWFIAMHVCGDILSPSLCIDIKNVGDWFLHATLTSSKFSKKVALPLAAVARCTMMAFVSSSFTRWASVLTMNGAGWNWGKLSTPSTAAKVCCNDGDNNKEPKQEDGCQGGHCRTKSYIVNLALPSLPAASQSHHLP